MLVAGCTAEGDGSGTGVSAGPSTQHEGAGIGPGISIKEARNGKVKGPILVRGYLLVRAGHRTRLCTALTKTQPPRCRGPSLVVRGEASQDLNKLTAASSGKARWSPEPVRVLGTLEGVVLVVLQGGRA